MTKQKDDARTPPVSLDEHATAGQGGDTATPNEFTQSFDARDWAKAWCGIAKEIEAANDGRLVIDEGWMISWFANALMRGWDERARRDAPVIADLLSGCKAALGAFEHNHAIDWDELAAAIAKAEGR